MRILNSCVVQ